MADAGSPYPSAVASALAFIGGMVAVALGAWLTRRHGKRAQAERLLVEALNDAVAAIAGVAGGAGVEAQRLYASAVSRVALHGSPEVITALRRFQEDPTTVTESGCARLVTVLQTARAELGHRPALEDDLRVLLFGAGPVDVESWAQASEQVGESVVALQAAGATTQHDEVLAQLAELAESAPTTAVLSAFGSIEHELQRIAQAGGLPVDAPAATLADMAARAGLVTPEAVSAVRGLVVLRNLAAHGGDEQEVTPARAREYIALVQAVLFVLSRPPQSPPSAPREPRS